jgi:hypothetical protein
MHALFRNCAEVLEGVTGSWNMKECVHLAVWSQFLIKLKRVILQVAYRKLLVAPGTMRNEFIWLIERYLPSIKWLLFVSAEPNSSRNRQEPQLSCLH